MPLAVHEVVDRLRPVDSPAAREAAYLAGDDRGAPVQGDVPGRVDLRAPVHVQAGRHRRRVRQPRRSSSTTRSRSNARWSPTPSRPARVRAVRLSRCIRTWSIPRGSSGSRQQGTTSATLVDAAIAADAAVLEGIPDDVTTALHICRGNFRSSWMCEGSLEPVAERVFGELPYDAFLVEWDDLGRDGGYEPVRYLREGSAMVMGIVSTKTPRARRRGRPRSGGWSRRPGSSAASTGSRSARSAGSRRVMVGNEIDEDTQWRKLELVSRVADRLWSR